MNSEATRASVTRDRPQPYPAVVAAAVGFAAIVLILFAGGRVGTVAGTWPLTEWHGMLSPAPVLPVRHVWAVVVLAGVAMLSVCWLVVHRAAESGALGLRGVAKVVACWSAPLIAGPPLFSNDSFSYTAQALLQLHGADPYRIGPAGLGLSPVLAAVDPRWQNSPAPYGPLTLLLEHACAWVAAGNAVMTLVLLRVLVEAALLLGAAIALLGVAPERRPAVLSCLAASPLVLVQVTSAGHLEGLLVLGMAVAATAAVRRHWTLAVVAATAAFAVKASVFPAVLALGWIHLRAASGRDRFHALARDLMAAALTYGAVAVMVPDSGGWVRALGTPAKTVTADAPTALVARLLTALSASNSLWDVPSATTLVRGAGLLAAAALCIWLILTHTRRSTAATMGLALLAVGLLAPVLYPWYLLWGLPLLALAEDRFRRVCMAGFSAAPLLAMPGLPSTLTADLVLVVVAAGLCALSVGLTGTTADDPSTADEPATRGDSARGPRELTFNSPVSAIPPPGRLGPGGDARPGVRP